MSNNKKDSKKTSSEERCRFFKSIERVVESHSERLLPDEGGLWSSDGRGKAQKINDALDRLREAVIYKNESEIEGSGENIRKLHHSSDIESSSFVNNSLLTVDAMLDVEIREWKDEIEIWSDSDDYHNGRRAGYKNQISLRRAVNISRDNFFNFPGATWGPLWGKTSTLEQVEEEIRQDLRNNK